MNDATPSHGLGPDSPLPARILGWVHERFPLTQGILILPMYMASALAGRAMTLGDTTSLPVRPLDALGFLALWAFFLLLRVFDEHKDYAKDLENHPERVLQSGLITLGHLKALGVLAVLTQGVASFLADGMTFGPAMIMWLVVMVWSSLMAAEFFIGEWLEKRLVLYATSHMVVMPMAVFWIMHVGAGGRWLDPAQSWPLLVVGFCAGAALEVTRKTRAPEEERDTVDSYARDLGIPGAVATIMTFPTASAGAQSFLAHTLEAPAWLHAPIWLSPVLMLGALVSFMRSPTIKARKTNEGVVALTLLGGYVMVLASLFTTHSIS